jgi:DNA polymerase III subunit chi
MSDIGFYHLTRSTLSRALPQLLVRTLASGQRALVLGTSVPALDALSTALWEQPAWLPHGATSDGDPDLQPIWLSTEPEPLNGARYLFLVDGAEANQLKGFERVFDLFDGNNAEAVAAARLRWKAAGARGHVLTYWQQNGRGWEKKAA